MKNILTLIAFFLIGTSCFAQQFTYKPTNPAFGGDTFNYNWLLSSANAQNSDTAERDEREEQSDLDRFGDNINSQILSQISRALLEQQLGDFKEYANSLGIKQIGFTKIQRGPFRSRISIPIWCD